jgi:hypothetical protein
MSRNSAIDIEMKRAALLAIAEENGGVLAPHTIVDAARNPSNALHDEFEWDDDEAASMYRLLQAAQLIRRVKITLVREDVMAKKITLQTVRQYHSRPSMRSRDGGYETLEDIMAAPEKLDELLRRVLADLRAYRRRYSALAALSDVWHAIDVAVEQNSDLIEPRKPESPEKRPIA